MNPGKAPWLFKAKKMMEDWKGYKVADPFVLTTSNILFLLLVVERLQGSWPLCVYYNYVAFSEVLGHYMGNYPAVTIQDFALAKELFNRWYNIDEWSLDFGLDLIWKKRKNAEAKDVIQYSWNMIITVFSGRNGAGEARQLFHDI